MLKPAGKDGLTVATRKAGEVDAEILTASPTTATNGEAA